MADRVWLRERADTMEHIQQAPTTIPQPTAHHTVAVRAMEALATAMVPMATP